MLLKDSLRIRPGDVLAFVGAGGKSSAIARLVIELQGSLPILVTTTTRLAHEQTSIANTHVFTQEPDWVEQLKARIDARESVLLTAEPGAEGKWTAPDENDLLTACELILRSEGVMLVEADGARRRSLKAPTEHEPAMPSFATQVVLVSAVDAVGSSLSDDVVHRPELAGPLMGLEAGDPITTGAVARLLSDPHGGLKGINAGITIRCLVNKIRTENQLNAGREIAASLISTEGIQSILLCNLQDENPVQEVHGRIAGVVLAAGGSTRFGRQKLLENWRGEALIRYAVRAALRSELDMMVVVVGAQRAKIEQSLSDMPVGIVVNEAWREGQAGSLRLGLGAVPERTEGVVFLLGDMPLVEPELINALIREHQLSLGPIVAPIVGGQRANPVLFDQVTFQALAGIQGDHGGRALYDRFPVRELPWRETAATDVDTLDDLRQLS